MIDRSYDLLSAVEQALLSRLSVFSGGWTLDATEHVCTGDGIAEVEVLDLLTSLADKSLISAEASGALTGRVAQPPSASSVQRISNAETRKQLIGCFPSQSRTRYAPAPATLENSRARQVREVQRR